MFTTKQIVAAALSVAALVALPATAEVTTIDFTDGSLFGPGGKNGGVGEGTKQSYTTWVEGVGFVTLTAHDGTATGDESPVLDGYLTFNEGTFFAPGAGENGIPDLVGDGDGIGIDTDVDGSRTDDEVSVNEVLRVSFDSASVDVLSFTFLDVFEGFGVEKVQFTFDDNTVETTTVAGTGDGGLLFKTLDNPKTDVVWIDFFINGNTDADFDNGDNDFALAAITVNGTIPEPATWLMMILGFALAGTAMKRRARSLAVA